MSYFQCSLKKCLSKAKIVAVCSVSIAYVGVKMYDSGTKDGREDQGYILQGPYIAYEEI